ncbi:MAG: outer membrane protein assembly factor BamD [Alphaproteobacteria bacterium]
MNRSLARTLARATLVLSLGLIVAGCAKKDEEPYIEGTVESLYNSGMDFLAEEKFADAATHFNEVERQHPYSVWATKAQLMAAYAHYSNRKYDDALNAIDRFIQLHPGNRDAAYAYYLRALCYYEQISDIKRDQQMTEKALSGFQEIVRRFPESRFARDSREKIDLTEDHLAAKEMEVGRYYLKRGQHLAATNRFRKVAQEFQTSTHVAEALHRLVECYMALGITDEARRTAAVLGFNFPGSLWYVDSYALIEGVRVGTATGQKQQKSFWDWLF